MHAYSRHAPLPDVVKSAAAAAAAAVAKIPPNSGGVHTCHKPITPLKTSGHATSNSLSAAAAAAAAAAAVASGEPIKRVQACSDCKYLYFYILLSSLLSLSIFL